jgi:hypothetical protein
MRVGVDSHTRPPISAVAFHPRSAAARPESRAPSDAASSKDQIDSSSLSTERNRLAWIAWRGAARLPAQGISPDPLPSMTSVKRAAAASALSLPLLAKRRWAGADGRSARDDLRKQRGLRLSSSRRPTRRRKMDRRMRGGLTSVKDARADSSVDLRHSPSRRTSRKKLRKGGRRWALSEPRMR